MLLGETLSLPLRRDPIVYGALSAIVLIHDMPAPHKTIEVERFEVTTDANGRFTLFIPLEHQQKSYRITLPSSSASTTLHAPCGPNDIVLL